MDADGVIRFARQYPNTTGGVVGGRATFRDTRNKGNTFLSCAPCVRAYVFGEWYDEVDMSRAHVTHVFGCWALSGRPHTITLSRFLTDQADLETEMTDTLARARQGLLARLARISQQVLFGVPDPIQAQRIALIKVSLSKTYLKPKNVFSSVINCKSPSSWDDFRREPNVIKQVVDDLCCMREAVLMHPLCVTLANALLASGCSRRRAISLSLGHLDDQALQASSAHLDRAGCSPSVTVNDSLTIYRSASPPHLMIPSPSDTQVLALRNG